MRFPIDAQLPSALARWLSTNGHDAEHVADLEMEAAPDSVIWDYELKAAAAIVTKDEDLQSIAPDSPSRGHRRREDRTCRAIHQFFGEAAKRNGGNILRSGAAGPPAFQKIAHPE